MLSDSIGRKPAILIGFFIYIIGCLLCFFSNNINTLIASRFIQAFGGSVGSVIGQAICRDVFTGPNRAAVFSSIGAGLSFFPAIGPVVGGAVSSYFGGWRSNFVLLFLIGLIVIVINYFIVLLFLIGLIVIVINYFNLPETLEQSKRNTISNNLKLLIPLIKKMILDKRVLTFGFLMRD